MANYMTIAERQAVEEIDKATRNEYEDTKQLKVCICKGCTNNSDQGGFKGVLCSPCHTMITTGQDNPSENFIHKLHKRNNKLEAFVDSLAEIEIPQAVTLKGERDAKRN